jgi:Mce-associated membrane protein
MSKADIMTGQSPGPARVRHPVVVAVLAFLALLLAAACVAALIWPTAVPGKSRAEKATDRDLAVQVAATAVTKAFLDVDYKDMDKRIDTVLNLSTGTFRTEYEGASVNLKALAQQSGTVSSGSVRSVGIGDIDDDTAVVYVAADRRATDAETEKKRKAGQTVADDVKGYRYQLTMSLVNGKWLLSDLKFIV